MTKDSAGIGSDGAFEARHGRFIRGIFRFELAKPRAPRDGGLILAQVRKKIGACAKWS